MLKVEDLKKLQEQLRTELTFIQDRMKKHYNKTRLSGPTLKEGDMVYLIRKNLKTKRPSDKLDHKKLGPFKITEKISTSNYRLSLPKTMRIHPVFHVSLLEPAPKGVQFEGTVEIDPEEEEYEVENILDLEERDGEVKYLVKWKGYPPEENTWEPIAHL